MLIYNSNDYAKSNSRFLTVLNFLKLGFCLILIQVQIVCNCNGTFPVSRRVYMWVRALSHNAIVTVAKLLTLIWLITPKHGDSREESNDINKLSNTPLSITNYFWTAFSSYSVRAMWAENILSFFFSNCSLHLWHANMYMYHSGVHMDMVLILK
jgi:hypothetical protein